MERINTVKFSQLTNWSVLFLTTKAIGYNRDYKLFPIGSFLRPSGESITIKDTEEYVQVTVHTDNGGLEVRDKKNKYKLGKDIGGENGAFPPTRSGSNHPLLRRKAA